MCHHPGMGRHARGAVRSRVTLKAVGIALTVLLIVAAGSWWAVRGTGSDDLQVRGSAVVVSSLACQNGDEGTVVDLINPVGQPAGTTRRATLDACGHSPGEVLAVDYSTGDPSRVLPAAAVADGGSTGGLLPLGLLLASLLGVAALVAVIRDGRRGRRAADDAPEPDPQTTGRHGRHALPDEDEPPMTDEPVLAPVRRPSDLDLLFPSRDSLAVSLHDELFTHRSPAGV